MFLFLILSACSQSEGDKIQKYLDEKTSYDISTALREGVLTIEVPMIDHIETWNKEGQMDVNLETIILLEAVKGYPREKLDLFNEVNFHFNTIDKNKNVAEIKTKIDTIMETNWGEVDIHEVPQTVDNYKFNGTTN